MPITLNNLSHSPILTAMFSKMASAGLPQQNLPRVYSRCAGKFIYVSLSFPFSPQSMREAKSVYAAMLAQQILSQPNVSAYLAALLAPKDNSFNTPGFSKSPAGAPQSTARKYYNPSARPHGESPSFQSRPRRATPATGSTQREQPKPAAAAPKRSPYEILGLSSQATRSEVTKKYYELARLHHPDKGGNAELFKDISNAKMEILEAMDIKS